MEDHSNKAAEANGPPPSYAESTSQPAGTQNTLGGAEPISPTQNGPQTASIDIGSEFTVNHNAPTGGVSNHSSIPMFITARTSVYGACPVEMDCPYCQVHIVTHIDRVAGMLPWVIMAACIILGFFLLGIPWCFCCVPFCVDSCLDVVHSCPACRRHLGRFNRM